MAEPRTRLGIFARNITSNLAGYVVGAAVAIFLSPFVIRELGPIQYGLWVILVSMTGYYGLLDLGVRSAVGQYVTRYWAKKDLDGVNRTMSTSFVLLCAVALLAVLVTIVLWFLLPGWIEAKNATAIAEGEPAVDAEGLVQLIADTQLAMLVSGIGIALGIPMALWATITYAKERFEIANAIGISERLVIAGLTVLALIYDHGVIGVAVATVGTQLLAGIVRIWVGFKIMPGLSVRPAHFSRDSVKELASYGIYNFVVNAADRIVLYMDVLVIGTFMVLAAATYYEVGMKLVPHYMSLILAITWTLTPYATACDSRGDIEALRQLLLKGTRGTMFVAAVIAAGFLLAGDEFLPVWLDDPARFPPDVIQSCYHVLAVLTWATLIRAASSCGRQILFGMRRMKLLASLAFTEATLNIGLSFVLVQYYGLVGVALGTLISIVLVYFLGQNYFIVKVIHARHGDFAWQLFRASVPVMVAMWLVSMWLDTWLEVHSWSTFLLEVLLLLTPVLPIGFLVVATREERELILDKTVFRFRKTSTRS